MIFAGIADKNLTLLQDFFKSKLVMRGSNLFIEGNKEEINTIEKLVQDIVYIINKKSNISDREIQLLLSSEIIGSKNIDKEIEDKIILHTHRGAVSANNPSQKKYLKAVLENDIVFAIGPAGTGKTYQAVAMAVSALKNSEVSKIIITRPVVEAGENLGFLPGDLKDKIDPYLTPLYDALDSMLPQDKIKKYMDSKQIEIAPLAYMRGRTLHNAFIILDEAQNSTQMQMKMFLTRIGVTSKAIITGDVTQVDLNGHEISGLKDAVKVLDKIKGICFVKLTNQDVVRHKLVKEIIKAYNKEEE